MVKIFIDSTKFYQVVISPSLPYSCRYSHLCSKYDIEALRLHSLFRSGYLSIKRILRCHPWNKHGHYPVPK